LRDVVVDLVEDAGAKRRLLEGVHRGQHGGVGGHLLQSADSRAVAAAAAAAAEVAPPRRLAEVAPFRLCAVLLGGSGKTGEGKNNIA
jgi:hypothetical protein